MPELPEVTALAEALTVRTAGLRVARVEVAAISALKTFDPPVSAVAGCDVLGFSRRGKHLVLELVDPEGEPLYVVIHLSRAGWAAGATTRPRHLRRSAGAVEGGGQAPRSRFGWCSRPRVTWVAARPPRGPRSAPWT